MNEKLVIECKPSKWFKIRAVLVLLMLGFFALWFFKDGMWGYREKNVEYVNHSLFKKKPSPDDEFAKTAYQYFSENDYTEESWAEFASKQVVPTPAKERGLLPADYDYSTKWPVELVNGYDAIKKGNPLQLWNKVSAREEWSQKPGEKIYDEGKIREQFIVGGICVGLFLIAAFICGRIMLRRMAVTETSYIAPGETVVPFTAMHKIDMRKWDNKGIATVYYKEDGATKKVKVDGMVYGQFKAENGAPAEALFAYIMENFKGELVEFIDQTDDEDTVALEVDKVRVDTDSENS